MGALLVGIDVGTASSKGVLTRPDGTVVAEARADHAMAVPRPGWAEHDADAVWWADVCSIGRRLAAAVPPGDAIAGVALSAIGPTLLPLDAAGLPLRPSILYGVDARASDEIASLESQHGREALAAFTGHDLSSQAIGPKILWLERNEPEVAAAARWYVTATSYLGLRLTGQLAIDAHTASHWNPMFDRSSQGWSDRFAVGSGSIIERLPPIRWPADQLGVVTPEGAAASGLPAGVPVTVGTVDALAEALSVGVVEPGDLMIMYGSTTFFLLITDRPVDAGPLWLTAGLEPGRWAIAAGLATGGSALAWFRDQFARDLVDIQDRGGGNAFEALAAEAGDAGRGGLQGDDVLVLPYLSGERTPINDPFARGVIAGLSLGTTRGDVYRGLLRGIAHAARMNVEAMRALGLPVRRCVAVGGGTADRLLLRLVSDATGLDQVVPVSTIGASRGDAFLAGVVSGTAKRSDVADWVDVADTVRADASRGASEARRGDRFRELYRTTAAIVHDLARGEDEPA